MQTWIFITWTLGYFLTGYGTYPHAVGNPERQGQHTDPYGTTREDGINCRLRQTMAWQECGGKVVCDSTCKTGTDCAFPYCNWLGLCECMPAFCKTDRMCGFFSIDCSGNFTCQNRQCFCD